LHVCTQLNVLPQQSLVVGDYLFDLQSARQAGAKSVLYRSQQHSIGHEHEADFVIDDLNQLPDIITNLENNSREPEAPATG
jgi:phosphoglycolate phosphatase-like HAD superfamily hydrolase